MVIRRAYAAAILLFFAAPPLARGDFVATLAVDVARQQSGNYLYRYTVSNDISSSDAVHTFSLTTVPAANPTMPSGPDGWVFSSDVLPHGTLDIVAWTLDIINFDPLAPGDKASFSFVSPLAPVPLSYKLDGVNINDIFTGDQIAGTVFGPGIASVPEPPVSLLLPMGTGFLALACYASSRQSHRQ